MQCVLPVSSQIDELRTRYDERVQAVLTHYWAHRMHAEAPPSPRIVARNPSPMPPNSYSRPAPTLARSGLATENCFHVSMQASLVAWIRQGNQHPEGVWWSTVDSAAAATDGRL